MDRESLRKLDDLLIGNNYDDETLDKIQPAVQLYLDGLPAQRAAPLAEVPNALVAVAGVVEQAVDFDTTPPVLREAMVV